MFTAHASINLPVTPQWVWMHASTADFLKLIPPVSTVEPIDSEHLAVQIAGLHQEGHCVVKSTLREPPNRIAWHSISGALHLRAEIMVEREGAGSRLTVQLYALPRDARMYATVRLERAFDGLSEALGQALQQFASRFVTRFTSGQPKPIPKLAVGR